MKHLNGLLFVPVVKRKVSMCLKINRRNLHAEWKLLVLNRWCFIPFGQIWTKAYKEICPSRTNISPFYMQVDASFWWNSVSIRNGYLFVLNGYGSIFWLTWKIQDAEDYSKKCQKDKPKKDWIRLRSQWISMAVSPCYKVLPCSSFFWQKVSDKRKIGDWCILLLKNAENEKKRLNLASEWRLFDSLG